MTPQPSTPYTTFMLVLDCSPSMDAEFAHTTRRLAAREAAWDAVRTLQASPRPEHVRFAQVVFEGEARTWLPLTPVTRVRKEHLGIESFSLWGGTDICAGLMACEENLWPGLPRQEQGLARGTGLLQMLCRVFEEPRPAPLSTLPALSTRLHVLIVSDGQQNDLTHSEEDCVRQAMRLKEAGVRIYARGIGEPRQFGLLRRLVSNPQTDFGVDQAPDSLRQAFRHIAQGLIRGS